MTEHVQRNWRLVVASLAAALIAMSALAAEPSRPNILLIITDQQHAGMLGCAGNSYVKTPNLDRLAAGGARFERAYCGNPVCVPSRFSMFTGTLPSRIGMESNGEIGNVVPQEVLDNSMGVVFRRAGYQTVYGGKTHLPGRGKKNQIASYGFDELTKDSRQELATTCAKFLREKHERPFLLVASFINPHDICYMAIRAFKESGTVPRGAKLTPLSSEAIACLDAALKRPAGVSEDEFFARCCPPTPANYGIPEGELSVFGGKLGGFRGYVREKWTDQDWRLHRWAYARLTELVDGQIGQVLDALKESGLAKNTLVVMTSDHGDMDAAHRFEHKSLLYEEAVRVPLLVALPSVTRAGTVDREHLVSTGLDLIPTLCDFAGVAQPTALRGRSVKALSQGQPSGAWRKCLVVENQQARLLLSERWKYMVGAAGAIREMITDLERDPGEMKNLAAEPAYRRQLETGRRLLKEWYAGHNLTLAAPYIIGGAKEGASQ